MVIMGQAKQRGAREDRVTEALGLKKRNVSELKKELGLPADAEFCGYLVHIKSKDEFLHDIIDTPNAVQRSFSKTPDLAKRFDEFIDAYEVARKEKEEVVVVLFDIGKQFMVFEIALK